MPTVPETSDLAQARAGAAKAAPPPPGEPWTVLGLIRWSADWLANRGVDEARLQVEHLLAHVLDADRLGLYLHHDRPLSGEELARFKPLLRRRAAREPLQYILEKASFRGLELKVDRRGLIPRPETEELVDHVLSWSESHSESTHDVLDVGTGTGAIALSLRSEGRYGRVVAADVSPQALALARENAQANGLPDVEFRLQSGVSGLGPDERFHVVVSNPPYVADADWPHLQPEVRDWEPAVALRGGPAGLDVIRSLVEEAPRHLHRGGLLALEIGHPQAEAVRSLAQRSEALNDVRIVRDLGGKNRFLLARSASAGQDGWGGGN